MLFVGMRTQAYMRITHNTLINKHLRTDMTFLFNIAIFLSFDCRQLEPEGAALAELA